MPFTMLSSLPGYQTVTGSWAVFLPGPGKLERRKAAHESPLGGAIDSITPSLSRLRLSDSVQFVGHHFQGLLF